MLKFLILGAVFFYFAYKLFPQNLEKKSIPKKKGKKIHGNDEEDYIEYEEIE